MTEPESEAQAEELLYGMIHSPHNDPDAYLHAKFRQPDSTRGITRSDREGTGTGTGGPEMAPNGISGRPSG